MGALNLVMFISIYLFARLGMRLLMIGIYGCDDPEFDCFARLVCHKDQARSLNP